MAERAVALGSRIGVAFASASTLAPTTDLIEACAAAVGHEIAIIPIDATSAWEAFLAGDHDRYAATIAEHVRAQATEVDVIVLAQASMAPAASLLADLTVPVLTSPAIAIEAIRAQLG